MILTLGCGKFRVVDSDLEFGERRPDPAQCSTWGSATTRSRRSASPRRWPGAFETDVNSLPLSLVISWYEQKAVCVLLALLHLGVKNIRLGPKLPAFVTPEVLQVLVDTFNIMPIGTVEGDLAQIQSGQPANA